MLTSLKNKQQGQTIIEAIVALVIILLIITAIAVVIVNGLYNSSFIKNQNEANKFAQQGIETVRNIQENDLSLFKSYVDAGTFHCIDDVSGTLYTQDCYDDRVNTGNSYNRTVEFFPGGVECNNNIPTTSVVNVTVTVKWSSSKCPGNNTFCHESKLVSCMPLVYPASNP